MFEASVVYAMSKHSSLFCQISYTNGKGTNSDRHSTIRGYGINYDLKKFYNIILEFAFKGKVGWATSILRINHEQTL